VSRYRDGAVASQDASDCDGGYEGFGSPVGGDPDEPVESSTPKKKPVVVLAGGIVLCSSLSRKGGASQYMLYGGYKRDPGIVTTRGSDVDGTVTTPPPHRYRTVPNVVKRDGQRYGPADKGTPSRNPPI